MAIFFRAVALVAAVTAAAAAGQVSGQSPQPQQARITGRVTDGSGGALPGVTVTIASPNLATPMTATTDGGGHGPFGGPAARHLFRRVRALGIRDADER